MNLRSIFSRFQSPLRRRAFGWVGLGLDAENSGVKVPEPYRQSVWVQRAIKKVAQPVASVPLRFSLQTRSADETFDSPELSAYWESPVWETAGIPMNRFDFIEAAIGWLKLKGECFIIMDEASIVPFPELRISYPRGLLARPDRMREIIHGGNLEAWEFTDASNRRTIFAAEQVIQVKNWNPYNSWRGLGEYESARLATESDYASAIFSKNLAQNNGDQGVYIVAKGGIPDDAQRQQIESQLRSKREAQQRGEFRPLFITGDITIEDPKIKSPDAAFAENRLQNRHEIFLAFGVPPSMADKMESYSVGSASDWYLLINETCIPTGAKVAEAVERISRKLTGQPLYAWFDFNEHPVMQQVRRERIDAALKLWGTGMPMDDISEYMDLSLPEYEGSDIGYLPFSVSPAGGPLPEASPEYQEGNAPPSFPEEEPEEELEEESDEEPIEAMLRLLRSGCPSHASHASPTSLLPSENLTLRDPRTLATWRTHMAQRRAVLKGYAAKYNRILMEARRQVLANLESQSVSGKALLLRAPPSSLMFDLPGIERQFLTLMRGQATAAWQTAGDQLFSELGLKSAWQAPQPEVLSFLRQRENKLAKVPAEIYSEIQDALTEGLNAGEPVVKLQARVRSVCNDMSRTRATRVAMTETAAVYGEARNSAMIEAGVARKRWLTSGLANVRPFHAQAGRDYVTPIPIDEPFFVGGEKLMFPGDPNGSAENVINCHCVCIAVPPEDTANPPIT